ncbi:membrane protein EE40 [Elephantid betaherpesvirus 1]|uniref:Membrane protein EE40 n=1 Tax=Elephantid herpesvirus 1 TaxID=146015 RepID=M4JZ82_ELHV1|nr:membrane protein EE40 [Elephantid betaherpesvirus 1]AGE09994.1 membrane protein EE40 [Elephantid betaherpesvirus 1]
MHVESEADIERIYQTNFLENCSYLKQSHHFRHDKYTLDANLPCVFKTAEKILQFQKVYSRYDFTHTDAYITSVFISIAIIALLLGIFYREVKTVYKSVSILDPCLCITITTWALYHLWTRDFMIGLYHIKRSVRECAEFNYFINVYSVMLCVISASCLCVYVRAVLNIRSSKSPEQIGFQLGFVRTVSRRLVPYLAFLLLRLDYSFFELGKTIDSSVIRELVLFLVYVVVFFLSSEILDTYLTCLTTFCWRDFIIISCCMWFYNKHCYDMIPDDNYAISMNLYLGVDLNGFSVLLYLLTKLLLLYK